MARTFNLTARIIAAAGLMLGATAPAARADSASSPAAANVGVLSGEWWQLVVSVPPADNPLLDTTGTNCMVGNRGPVWFLYGNAGTPGTPIVRTCTLPQGEKLFFPVYNFLGVNTPDICGQVGTLSLQALRAQGAAAVASVSRAHATLDGVSLDNKIVRAKSPAFATTFPDDNIYFGDGCHLSGVYSPSIADGLYVLLQPLNVGTHTLTIETADNATPPVTVDVTYTLNIVPVVTK